MLCCAYPRASIHEAPPHAAAAHGGRTPGTQLLLPTPICLLLYLGAKLGAGPHKRLLTVTQRRLPQCSTRRPPSHKLIAASDPKKRYCPAGPVNTLQRVLLQCPTPTHCGVSPALPPHCLRHPLPWQARPQRRATPHMQKTTRRARLHVALAPNAATRQREVVTTTDAAAAAAPCGPPCCTMCVQAAGGGGGGWRKATLEKHLRRSTCVCALCVCLRAPNEASGARGGSM